MDRHLKLNGTVHCGACFRSMARWERKPVIERVQRIMKLPLEYVPNQQFDAWSRDKCAETEVLRAMPDCSEPAGEAPPPTGLALT